MTAVARENPTASRVDEGALSVGARARLIVRSRILGRARTAITLNVLSHLFEQARHAADVRAAMAGSRFAHILAQATATEPWLEKETASRGRIGRARRAQGPVARPASVARHANAAVLDRDLTNARSPRRRRQLPRNPADFQGVRWS